MQLACQRVSTRASRGRLSGGPSEARLSVLVPSTDLVTLAGRVEMSPVGVPPPQLTTNSFTQCRRPVHRDRRCRRVFPSLPAAGRIRHERSVGAQQARSSPRTERRPATGPGPRPAAATPPRRPPGPELFPEPARGVVRPPMFSSHVSRVSGSLPESVVLCVSAVQVACRVSLYPNGNTCGAAKCLFGCRVRVSCGPSSVFPRCFCFPPKGSCRRYAEIAFVSLWSECGPMEIAQPRTLTWNVMMRPDVTGLAWPSSWVVCS